MRHPDEVAQLVERIRASENHVPELELVAEDDSGITGFVMLSWAPLEGAARDRILNLSPLAVRPDRRLQGIGAALTREALRRADELGEPAVMLEGIPGYYPRFGFERASAHGYVPPSATVPDEAFMVKRFAGWAPEDAGRIVYPEAFAHLTPP